MERNFCIWSGILTRTVRYAVGTIKWQSRTGDDKVDAAYEQYWEDWCRRADIKGRHHFRTLVQLYLRSMLRDGDVGVVLVDESGDLRLQGIEADRIGDPNRTGEYAEGKVRGIILGEGDRPEAYEVTKRTRNNPYEKDEEVRAGQFIHLFDLEPMMRQEVECGCLVSGRGPKQGARAWPGSSLRAFRRVVAANI